MLARTVVALERESLRWADRLVAPAGTLAAYRRYYGPDSLSPASSVPPPFVAPAVIDEDRGTGQGARLRVLFVGRMQLLKGTRELVRAVRALERDDIELTLVGDDTDTAPSGGSMRARLRALAGGDPRIVFMERVDRTELARLLRSHHVVAMPSRFESFSYVIREALAANRPVVATEVGGIAAGFEEGRSGWLLPESTAEALTARLAALADDRDAVDD